MAYLRHSTLLAVGLLIYIIACRFVIRNLRGSARELTFAGLNIAALYRFLFYNQPGGSVILGIYMFVVLFQFAALRMFSERKGWLPWLAFLAPISMLILVRYVPGKAYEGMEKALGWANPVIGLPLLGISYLAFRCSRLVLEIRNGAVTKPTLFKYLNFCFFLPTMSVGPINSYANYRVGFDGPPLDVPVGRAALRILVGLVKYQFLGGLCSQLSYASLLLDDHPHPWMDLPVAMLFYYLFLYCNFSGFCDMAIGASSLVGIQVPENFDSPFLARNMREFWNRWHITLSQWMRDVVFAPLSKFLVRLMGPGNLNHAIALTIAIVFLVIGIWHGVGWNYFLFGAAQSLGVVCVHYYTAFLKKRLGVEGFKRYNQNRWIYAVAVAVTFCYYSVTLFFFANSLSDMRTIISVLR